MGIRFPRVLACGLALLCAASGFAQDVPSRPLITKPVNDGQLVRLKGNTYPLARPQFDIGIADTGLPLNRMLLVLRRSPEQEFALQKLLDAQQDKASPEYHRWLTPDDFGARFGPSDQDLQLITGWLQTHGFQINRVSHGRTVIEFSGNEGQLESAFHTQIHKYLINGEEHWANASDPEIPVALAPAVAGVWSLHNFRKKPKSKLVNRRFATPQAGNAPFLTSGTLHGLMPGDYATIYNINPLYSAGMQGNGTTIAVIGRSNFDTQDVLTFREIAGLSATIPNVILDGADPGNLGGGEEAEAVLDATWSGALAPFALVDFVLSASTNSTDGVDLSEVYAIDHNLGDVMTESFGSCEGFASQSEAQAISALAEQAAAQGITYMVSSGDSGAEGCANPNLNSANGQAPSVNVLASSAFNVAVGGTMFNENGNDAKYWSASNNQVNLSSAKSYIPENVWNESCPTCGLWAGGGGASVFVSKPTWQSGPTGIPADGVRDLPDVSLTAAGHDPYLLCFEGSCSQGFLVGIAGTSASAPSFAGIMALIVQQHGRQGQANYVLYRLAASETLSQCNGSNTSTLPSSTCIFYDTTKGNNAVPGELGFGTASAQYQAKVGYDLATGLGSINVNNLSNKWSTVAFNATSTALAPNPITGTHGSPIMITASVTPAGGSGVPTGDVSLNTSTGLAFAFLTLSNGTVTSAVDDIPGGVYTLTARYAGDSNFAPSPPSNPVDVHIDPENSTASMSVLTADASGRAIPFTTGPYGSFVYLRSDITGSSGHGVPSGLVNFTDNGNLIFNTTLNSEGTAVTGQGLFTLGVGPHSVVAQYGGDPSFNSSSSAAAPFTIVKASTLSALSASPASVPAGTDVNLTVTVTSSGFGNSPAGTVNYFSGTSQIGSAQLSSNGITASGAGSTAFLNLTNLPAGDNTISAQYGGDANYLSSMSNPITVTVQPNFTITAGSPGITISSPGGSGSLTLTIVGDTGYNSTINFTAASCTGLPLRAQCSFNPQSVTGSGSTTLTVITSAPRSARNQFGTFTAGFLFAAVLLCGVSRRRLRASLLSIMIIGTISVGTSCGGGSSAQTVQHTPGTPLGSTIVTVSATAGSISHSTSFTLTVN